MLSDKVGIIIPQNNFVYMVAEPNGVYRLPGRVAESSNLVQEAIDSAFDDLGILLTDMHWMEGTYLGGSSRLTAMIATGFEFGKDMEREALPIAKLNEYPIYTADSQALAYFKSNL